MPKTYQRRKSKAATPEEESDEAEYEVEDIIDHERSKNKLLYQVSWVGYPDELTWIPEADMENAPAIIAKYWKKQSADVQHERYPKGSKEAKAAREAAATPRSARKSNSKKRAAEDSDEDEFQAEEDDEEKVETEEEEAEDSDAPKSRRKSSGSAKANGSVKKERKASPAKKKAKKETSAKKDKKAEKPSPSPEVEEEQMDQDQDEAVVHEAQPAVSNHNHPMSDNHLKHMEEADWHEITTSVATIEQNDKGVLLMHVVWKEDDTASEVSSDIARAKCPQRGSAVIDFYERHLRFRQADQQAEEEEEEEVEAE